jgi:hypothetical protein
MGIVEVNQVLWINVDDQWQFTLSCSTLANRALGEPQLRIGIKEVVILWI